MRSLNRPRRRLILRVGGRSLSLRGPLLAALSAAGLILAFPLYGLRLLAFIALVPLLVGVRDLSPLRALALGLFAGVLFYTVNLSWLMVAMVEFGRLPRGVGVILLLLLAGYVALFLGIFCALYAWLRPASPWLELLLPPALWTGLEVLRAHALTGFPWAFLAYTQAQELGLIRVATWAGMYGVSFLIVLANAAIALLLTRRTEGLARVRVAAGALALGAAMVGLGAWGSRPADDGRELRVALIQGNIPQGLKWSPEWRQATAEIYRRLTLDVAETRPDLIVWPETALPFFLGPDLAAREWVARLATEADSSLLIGSLDVEQASPPHYLNSAFLVSPGGEITQKYDKIHLVPFGEYVPLKRLLFFAQKLTQGAVGDFSPGTGRTVFALPGARFGVTISYEVYFPHEVRRFFLNGADFLVNITNDAWYGRTAAARQHMAMAVFRSVENGAYLVRAANTGISGVVDPQGRVTHEIGEIFTRGTLGATIRVARRETLYTRYGDVFAWGTVAFVLCLISLRIRRAGSTKRRG